jgi:deoxyhypusine synthase
VKKGEFAGTLNKPVSFSRFWDSLPDILAGKSLKNLVQSIVRAREKDKPVILCFGAHVIKCGLAPLLIDLCRRGIVTALATNGASTVHDFELSFAGQTSEDVAVRLKDGSFGMTRETGEFLNQAAKLAAQEGAGLGYVIGREIEKGKLPNRSSSVFASAYRLRVPATVHVAIGTDIIYQHPQCDGAAWGQASYDDFKKFAESVSRLGSGGVLLNFGSAVILPEVFLKSLTVCRNLGYDVFDFTTANFDMIRQYRPFQNIVSRPTQDSGRGYDFTGHHEIMMPLLYAALTDSAIRVK